MSRRWAEYFASFSLSQVALKVVDASLDVVDGALNKVGSEETGSVRAGVRMIHSTANTIRLDAVKKDADTNSDQTPISAHHRPAEKRWKESLRKRSGSDNNTPINKHSESSTS